MDRRDFVATAAAGAAATGAGCLGGGSGGSGGGALDGHPASAGLDGQPRLGPTDAPARIVAFEDPSCPACRRFERDTFPVLAGDAEAGDLAFHYRGIPVVHPWGEPGCHLLEAAYAADEEAFWALKEHYYAEQRSYPGRARLTDAQEDEVYSRTEAFLSTSTDVDVDAVLSAARDGDHRGAVQDDMSAARSAGVRGTPTFFLFADGDFVTDVSGPQGYAVFANALGL